MPKSTEAEKAERAERNRFYNAMSYEDKVDVARQRVAGGYRSL